MKNVENSRFSVFGIRPNSVRISIAVLACTLMVLVTLTMMSLTGLKMMRLNAPLVDASMEIKIHLALFHLRLEEIFNGGIDVPEEEIWEHLGQAEWYAHAMLEGGRNLKGTFLPLEDPSLRVPIETVLSHLAYSAVFGLEKLNREVSANQENHSGLASMAAAPAILINGPPEGRAPPEPPRKNSARGPLPV